MRKLIVILASGTLAVACALGAALLPSGTAAQAAFPGQNGKIAFDHLGEDVYTIDSDGANKSRLTDSPAKDYEPAWSPNGKRIAFTSDRTGKEQVFTTTAAGADTRRLTGKGGSSAGWSPSGKKIVFERGHDLWKMNADGSNEERLTNTPSYCELGPAWSPTGEKIAFMRRVECDGSAAAIHVMKPDGTGTRKILGGGLWRASHPEWSPDGKRIAYDHFYRGEHAICVTGKWCEGYGDTPDFSPDGEQIVIARLWNSSPGLYQMDAADGTDVGRIPNTDDAQNPDWQPAQP